MTNREEGRDPDWRRLELRVADLYRAFGFDAQDDVLLSGKQWDVVATRRVPGAGSVRVCVEVKDHPDGSMPITEVRSFEIDARNALAKQDCDKAVLVTSGRVTRQSKQQVDNERAMEVLSFAELERQLFDVAEPLSRWLVTYLADPRNAASIDLRAKRQQHNLDEDADLRESPRASYLLNIALNHPGAGIIVFGDFGTGKTTTLKQLMADAVRHHQADDRAPVPLLLRLREYGRAATVEGFVLEAIQRGLGIGLRPDTFWQMVGAGRFVFLFDGFDEITLRADQARRSELLAALSPLLFSPCPAIITSRPSYFATDHEYQELLTRRQAQAPRVNTSSDPGGQRINRFMDVGLARILDNDQPVARPTSFAAYELEPLSSAQIDEFLERSAADFAARSTTPAGVRAFLDSVYDLSELIRTPVILEMAVVSVAEGLINPATNALSNGPAALYEAYAGLVVQRDWVNVPNRTEGLTMDQRLAFAEACAIEMASTNTLTIPADRAMSLLRTAAGALDETELEGLLTEARTCSFLTNAEAGGLDFIHRSYQEFFFARRLKADIEREDYRRLRQPLRWEYLYFLGAFGHGNNNFYNDLLELSRKDLGPNTSAPDNAATALLAARPAVKDLRWQDRTIAGLRRESITITSSTLHGVCFDEPALDSMKAVDSTLDVVATGGNLGEVALQDCNGSVELRAEAREVRIHGGKLRLEMFGRTRALTVDASELDLTMSHVAPVRIALHRARGRVRCEPTVLRETQRTVEIASSSLSYDAGGGETSGAIADSVIEVPIETFDQLTASLTRTTLAVRGQRPIRVAERGAAGQRVRRSGPSSENLLVLLDPDTNLDAWWSRQDTLITIGGNQGAGETAIRGVTVRSNTPRPPSGDDDYVHLRSLGPQHILLEGRGPSFSDAVDRLRDLTSARLAKLQIGGWLASAVRSFGESIADPAMLDELSGAIETHEHLRSQGSDEG